MESADLEAIKDEANSSFKSGDFGKAESLYLTIVQNMLDKSHGFSVALPPEELALYVSVLNNLSATELKLCKYEATINYSTTSINLDVSNIKAYYRRAMAKFSLAEFESALADIDMILSIESNNSQALSLRRQIVAKMEQLRFSESHRNYTNEKNLEANPVDRINDMNTVVDRSLSAGANTNGYGFMCNDWVPPPEATSETVGGSPLKPPSLQAISLIQQNIAKYQAYSNKSNKLTIHEACQQLSMKTTNSIKDRNILNENVINEFERLKLEDENAKKLFNDRIQFNKTTNGQTTIMNVHTKVEEVDSSKMHYTPAKYSIDAVDAWKSLEEEENQQVKYIETLKEQKVRIQTKRKK